MSETFLIYFLLLEDSFLLLVVVVTKCRKVFFPGVEFSATVANASVYIVGGLKIMEVFCFQVAYKHPCVTF